MPEAIFDSANPGSTMQKQDISFIPDWGTMNVLSDCEVNAAVVVFDDGDIKVTDMDLRKVDRQFGRML